MSLGPASPAAAATATAAVAGTAAVEGAREGGSGEKNAPPPRTSAEFVQRIVKR